MKIKDQLDFVESVIDNRKYQILQRLNENAENIEDWRPNELRQYIAHVASWGTKSAFILTGKRRINYNKLIKTTSL